MEINAQAIIDTIQKYSLTVRCLPHIVVSHWSYQEGDENKKYVDSNGNPRTEKRTVVTQNHDLEYFKNTPPPSWSKATPEQRYETFKKNFPNGRKLLREERIVKDGGWFYVKETPHTGSRIEFSRKHDEFFAPTLEGAIKLFLESKK